MISLTSITWKVTDKIFPEGVFEHMKVIEHSQHGFAKWRSWLSNLIAFYNEVTCLVDRGKVIMLFTSTLLKSLTLSPITSL